MRPAFESKPLHLHEQYPGAPPMVRARHRQHTPAALARAAAVRNATTQPWRQHTPGPVRLWSAY